MISRETGSEEHTLTVPITVNLVAILGILTSQFFFRHKFTVMEIDLPYLTELALGATFPVLLSVILGGNIVAKFYAKSHARSKSELVSNCVCGSVIGFYLIAMWVAFPSCPSSLTS